jgi:CBS domain-containing protein
MLRYGRDYGRWNGQGRYDWDRPGGYGPGYGGPRGDSWGTSNWQSFPSEGGGWMGDAPSGQGQGLRAGYDFDYGGGFGSGYSSGYGADYFTGRGGYPNPGWSGRGGPQQGGWDNGYGNGYPGGYEGRMDEQGGRRPGGEGSGMRAADIMTEEPEAVSPETTLAEVAQKMRDLDVGIIPVVENDQSRRLRGVVTDRDITIRATAEGKDARSTRVSEVMTSDVETVNKNDRVRDVLEVMRRERVKRVPVTDREGRLVGIIAEADLLVDYEGGEQERSLENTLERVYDPSRGPRPAMRGRGTGQAERPARNREEGREASPRPQPEPRGGNAAPARSGGQRKGSEPQS